MCGRLNVIDSPELRTLCEQLEIAIYPKSGLRTGRFKSVANEISIVYQNGSEMIMDDALWWLLVEPNRDPNNPLKPSRYTSFNTRYDKLNVPRSAGFVAFRETRCVMPVSGFGESQKEGTDTRYTDFIATRGAMLLGGLYRKWAVNVGEDQIVNKLSCSVVTLPAHDKIAPYHTKASPLMLSLEDGSAQTWLDTSRPLKDVESLLKPTIREALNAQPIDKPSFYNPIGDSALIDRDG